MTEYKAAQLVVEDLSSNIAMEFILAGPGDLRWRTGQPATTRVSFGPATTDREAYSRRGADHTPELYDLPWQTRQTARRRGCKVGTDGAPRCEVGGGGACGFV
jgi:hypothetical protein